MGHYGIIFNSNRELLRNYHAEKRFGMIFDLLSIEIAFYNCSSIYSLELHHYTCAGCFVSMVSDLTSNDEHVLKICLPRRSTTGDKMTAMEAVLVATSCSGRTARAKSRKETERPYRLRRLKNSSIQSGRKVK